MIPGWTSYKTNMALPECTHTKNDGTPSVIKHAMPDGSIWSCCVRCNATDRGDGQGWRPDLIHLPPPPFQSLPTKPGGQTESFTWTSSGTESVPPGTVAVANLTPEIQKRLGRTTGVIDLSDPALKPVARPDPQGRKIR